MSQFTLFCRVANVYVAGALPTHMGEKVPVAVLLDANIEALFAEICGNVFI